MYWQIRCHGWVQPSDPRDHVSKAVARDTEADGRRDSVPRTMGMVRITKRSQNRDDRLFSEIGKIKPEKNVSHHMRTCRMSHPQLPQSDLAA